MHLPLHPPDAPPSPPPRRAGDLRLAERHLLVAGVGLAHLAGLWALLQAAVVHDAVHPVAPRVIDVIALELPKGEPLQPPPPAQVPAPAPAPQPRPQPSPTPAPTPEPPPVVAAAPTPATEAPLPFAVPPPPEPPPAVTAASGPPVPPAPPTPPAPPPPAPAPPVPRLIPASQVAYAVPPPIEVPLASRRLGEAGTVHLRVRVGTDGLPKAVTVQRSSGHARLDEQALWAMKRARFTPQTDNGVPIEWIVIAPLQYEID